MGLGLGVDGNVPNGNGNVGVANGYGPGNGGSMVVRERQREYAPAPPPPPPQGMLVDEWDPETALPVFEVRPAMLAVDLSLGPGESRSCKFSSSPPPLYPSPIFTDDAHLNRYIHSDPPLPSPTNIQRPVPQILIRTSRRVITSDRTFLDLQSSP